MASHILYRISLSHDIRILSSWEHERLVCVACLAAYEYRAKEKCDIECVRLERDTFISITSISFQVIFITSNYSSTALPLRCIANYAFWFLILPESFIVLLMRTQNKEKYWCLIGQTDKDNNILMELQRLLWSRSIAWGMIFGLSLRFRF